jgi:hypothetical protein
VAEASKPEPKDIKPSLFSQPVERIMRHSDEIDSESSPVATPGNRRTNRSGDDVNSLNASMVEQEGKIECSPQKNATNQLFAGKNQNPFEIKAEMGFTN